MEQAEEHDANITVQKELTDLGIIYKKLVIDPMYADTHEFCKKYDYDEEDSGNTIIVASKNNPKIYCACLILATTKLDVNKKVRSLISVRRLSFANPIETVAQTKMRIGGVTIFGLPAKMRKFIDSKVFNRERIIVGGGGRSTKLVINPEELRKIPNVEFVESLALPKRKAQ